jgi:hypothetical protein
MSYESKHYRHETGRAQFLADYITGGQKMDRRILARNVENLQDILSSIKREQDSAMETRNPDCRKITDGYHAMLSILGALRSVDDNFDIMFTRDRNGEYRKVELLDKGYISGM